MKSLYSSLNYIIEAEVSKLLSKHRAYDIETNSEEGDKVLPDVADIMKKSYGDIGGFKDVESPENIKKKVSHMNVADVDQDPEPDYAILYRNQPAPGIKKLVAIGTDGGAEAKQELKNQMKHVLSGRAWIEVSGAPAKIFVDKYHMKTLNDPEKIQKLLPDKEITWHGKHPDPSITYGDGWYTRDIDGIDQTKIIVGNP